MEWRPIAQHPGYWVNSSGEIWKTLKGGLTRSGRRRVSLMQCGVTRYRLVDSLIAESTNSRDRWAPIPDFPGYAVSSDGVVIRRMAVSDNGAGYLNVKISQCGKSVSVYLHVEVCRAFHGAKPSPSHHACHINGSRGDNSPENVRWATPKENAADKWTHGTQPFGELDTKAVLSSAEVVEIRTRKSSGDRADRLALEFNVHVETIRGIARGAKRKHG